jgi:NAD(P)-dependent dehydrogenase (short-subunit alcohol dehydrogenase family)
MTSLTESKPVTLITGTSSGIGLLCAVALARAGFRVFASMRNLDRRGALDAAAREAGVELTVLPLDVTAPETISAAVDQVQREAGPIDVLVNNAGISMGGFAEDVSLSELRDLMETNFFGLVATTQAVFPAMRARRSGRILNMSSISGRMALPGLSSYCAAKFAVEGYSEALRYEALPHGVWVSLIEPGCFKTPLYDVNRRTAARALEPTSPHRAAFTRGEQALERILELNPQDPADVAKRVVAVARAKRPRLRYLVGKDAFAESWASALTPHPLFERALLKISGAGG